MPKYYIDIERITTERTSVLVVIRSIDEATDKCLSACNNGTINFDSSIEEPCVDFSATSNLDCTKEDDTLDEEQFSIDGSQVID